MSHRTKNWIKAMRIVQLCLRLPQVTAAAGLIVVMILAGLMSGLFAWIMGATVRILTCVSFFQVLTISTARRRHNPLLLQHLSPCSTCWSETAWFRCCLSVLFCPLRPWHSSFVRLWRIHHAWLVG
jgi:hypothetical protein